MVLHNIIKNNFYFVKLQNNTRDEVFMELVDFLDKKSLLSDKQSFYQDILARENIASTFMENGVAIPHAKSKHVKEISIVLGVSKDDVDSENKEYSSKARIFFMLAVPELAASSHLEIISQLAQYIINEDFCKSILGISSKEEFISLLNKSFDEKIEINTSNTVNKVTATYDLVAITACPVGIAHTYIAAEKLEKVAKELGFSIKVQTNGSIGIKNQLTTQEIQGAKAVILASDIDIDDSEFIGKKVYRCPVAKAIKETQEVIKIALSTQDIYSPVTKTEDKKQKGLGVYKHLLNGVSFMLPFVVIGGILIALSIALSGISEGSGVNVTNPILKKMLELGVMSFGLMVPILAGYIGFSIAGKPALAPSMVGGVLAYNMQTGFLGGIVIGFIAGYAVKYVISIPIKNRTLLTIMPILIIPIIGAGVVGIVMYSIGSYISGFMAFLTEGLKNMSSHGSLGILLFSGLLGAMIAVDMGGPINKVAFLFGASMIAEGVYTVMGPIAVAIAVPPLGMALATLIAPKQYLEEEKQAGKAAFFMGLIGITEGAIPFAASDPLRVIPSIVIGSTIAGMIAGYLKVANHAPHGGPIVLPVVDNMLGFIIALLVGVIITAIIVNSLKRLRK